ncbi:MAG: hypothetical protein K6E92_06475 [Lachnospiraceae bacterium]|nr:hypothetical protein [Lachnospiraceae bacterium]
MKRRIRKENGMITIEATLTLSFFMFAIVTFLSIINLCIAQARISYAINVTAKEISQYSYLYSLTGLNNRQADIYQAGTKQVSDAKVGEILSNVNTVYNEIQNLGKTGEKTPQNVDDIMNAWDGVNGSLSNMQSAGNSAIEGIRNIAKDPKNLLFGIAKLGASEVFDVAKSKLIAAPLAKVMCERHLSNGEMGAEEYLSRLGVVPASNGSYLDGLDFSESMLFPNGSEEITINVRYDVKVIPLLPIKLKFHLNQTAVTLGWMAGNVSYKSLSKYTETDSLWTQATVRERSDLIRHQGIDDLTDQGYQQVKGMTDVQLYDPNNNEFVALFSMNPLWNEDPEHPITLDDLNEDALRMQIERLCGDISSTTDGEKKVYTRTTDENGQNTTHEYNCEGAKNKIVLTIPEDPGLREKMEEIIAAANTNGVTIELNCAYGCGASSNAGTQSEGGNE